MAKHGNEQADAQGNIAAAGIDLMAAVFADAVTDVRRRVVEEGWFGQPQDGPASRLAEWSPNPTYTPMETLPEFDPYDPWGWHREPEGPSQGAAMIPENDADRGFDR